MKPSRAWLVALVLVAPTALAASDDLRAESFTFTGATSVESVARALFLSADEAAFSWDVVAGEATLHRQQATFRAVDHPTRDTALVAPQSDWVEDEVPLGAVSIVSTGVLPGGAMLVRSDDARLEGATDTGVDVRAVRDPVVAQGGAEPTDENEAGDPGYIVEEIPGELLSMDFAEGTFTIRGNLTLLLFGPRYVVDSSEAPGDHQTGEYETTRTLVYAEGKQERHLLALTDAVLHVRAAAGALLYTEFPLVQVAGSVVAEQADGALALPDIEVRAADDGALRYTGDVALALSPTQGLVGASVPTAALASTGATLEQGPPLLTLTAAAIATLVALGAAGALLWRRRARPQDDLEAALLAMDERRWEDALVPLARVAKARPHDAGVMVDRALCLEQVGRFQDAARGFEAALRTAPEHAEAHFYYARTLAKMRQAEAARVHLEAALERDPRLAEMARGERVLRGL